MARPFHELLADSLRRVRAVCDGHIVRSESLSRVDRERLLKVGALQKIIRDWYLLCQPHTNPGESTAWYASYWVFLSRYLSHRFGDDYCLSVAASLDLHLGRSHLPAQTVVMVKQGANGHVVLPHETSLLIYRESHAYPRETIKYRSLNVMPFEYALCKCKAHFYQQSPQEAEIALRLLESPEAVLRYLLAGGMAESAGRIVGALQHIQRDEMAEQIRAAMIAAGFTIRVKNPFQSPVLLSDHEIFHSPYAARIKAIWAASRDQIIDVFPAPEAPQDLEHMLAAIDKMHVHDACHSLSIEGYQVSETLIEKIAAGKWRPDRDADDRDQRNAMAAKGYHEAFQEVKATIVSMLGAKQPTKILQKKFSQWYLALFSPSVTAGILTAQQLAGYRNQPVYIRHARHVPPPASALRDCMAALFECLHQETHAAVRAVLTHWLIGFIHPYMDGNGRMARFMMNALWVQGGYRWTVVRWQHRAAYLQGLEQASVEGHLRPFAQFLLGEMQNGFSQM